MNAPAKIFLNYQSAEGKDFKDSCDLVNGEFELKGEVTSPVNSAQLYLKRYNRDFNNGIMLWIEPGTTIIMGTDSLPIATITGSKLNTEDQNLNAELKPFTNRAYELYKNFGFKIKDKTTPEYKEYIAKQAQNNQGKFATYRKFILANPNSLVSLHALVIYGGLKYGNQRGIEDVEPLFNGLSTEVRSSKMGNDYQKTLARWKVVGIGTIAPDFVLYDQDRKPVRLSDFKGKFILVDFWASWCHFCREENPNLVEQYKRYKDKNFVILGVSIDEEKYRNKWLKAIKDDHLTWPQVVGKVEDNEARLKFAVQGIPDNFLIAPNIYIIAKGLRGDTLNKKLAEILAEKK